jgi:WD40 repeat protein
MLTLVGHESAVTTLVFAAGGDLLLSGDRAGTVRRWAGGGSAVVSQADGAGVTALAVPPNGMGLATGTSGGWFFVFPGHDGELREPGVGGLAFVGESLLAVGVGSRTQPAGGQLSLVDAITGKRRADGFPAPKGVRGLCAAGGAVAWAEWGRVLYAWDVRKPDRAKLPLSAEAPAVALSPDGSLLVAGLDDYTVRLFDVPGRRERRVLKGHRGRVSAVAVTPDGRTVVSGGWDQTVRTWDAATGAERLALKGMAGKVTAVAVSPDGLRLAVGGDAGGIALVDLD